MIGMVSVHILKLFQAANIEECTVMISVKKKKHIEIGNCYLSGNSVIAQRDPNTSVYFSENYC